MVPDEQDKGVARVPVRKHRHGRQDAYSGAEVSTIGFRCSVKLKAVWVRRSSSHFPVKEPPIVGFGIGMVSKRIKFETF